MKKIVGLIDQELKWEQPSSFKEEYELRTGEELVATLRFRSSFGSLATAESADGCWTFKRVGFWQPKVTVRQCNKDDDIATYKNESFSSSGIVTLADGRTFSAESNFWQTKFEFSNEAGETLIQFKAEGMLHLSSNIAIGPGAVNLPELPWMVMFGWYIMVMMRRDAATTVAIISLPK
jgi:hypothetical protein